MSNQDKLLSDDELREQVRNVYVSGVTAQLAGDFSNQAETEKYMFDLINTQKRLYAESVVGSDDAFKSETISNEEFKSWNEKGMTYRSALIRDGLRAEQRARIK